MKNNTLSTKVFDSGYVTSFDRFMCKLEITDDIK